jgi:hypothetical protein
MRDINSNPVETRPADGVMGDPLSATGLVDAALEVSAWECDLMRRIRIAFEEGDEDLALTLTKQLVGLEGETVDETSH